MGYFDLASNIVGLFSHSTASQLYHCLHSQLICVQSMNIATVIHIPLPLLCPRLTELTDSIQNLRGDVTLIRKVPIRRSQSRNYSRSPSIQSYLAIYHHPAATRAALAKSAKCKISFPRWRTDGREKVIVYIHPPTLQKSPRRNGRSSNTSWRNDTSFASSCLRARHSVTLEAQAHGVTQSKTIDYVAV